MEVTRPNVRQECVTWREDVYFPRSTTFFSLFLLGSKEGSSPGLMDGSSRRDLELGHGDEGGGKSSQGQSRNKYFYLH